MFPFLLFSALLTVLLGSAIFVGGIFFKQYYRGPLGDYASLAPSIVFSLCIPTLGSFFQHVSLRYALLIDFRCCFLAVFVSFCAISCHFSAIFSTISDILLSLTAWENFRTVSEYNANLVRKVFLFRFLTSYLMPLAVAAIYLPYTSTIEAYLQTAFGITATLDPPLEMLSDQVSTLLVTGHVIGVLKSLFLPSIMATSEKQFRNIKSKMATWRKRTF